ncbi:MAG TPA: DNA-directed RNA polymerase subunit omega [Planctomycetota bacterium]|nr:DNA-directed RNA polymerase subunit omega [Planctomycetota bacterium]
MEPRQLEELLNKVGGKYKLVTLFQKRMRELQRGMPRLVNIDSTNLWDVVSKEIMESKVDLIMGEEADQMRKELALRESEEAEKADKADKNKAREAKEAKALEAKAD